MITADRTVSTTCPYCGVGCGLQLHLKDDYIYKVTSSFDSVVNHGNLCVKGRFGYDFVYNKDRVTTPLIRKTAQAPGARSQAFERDQWREVSWDEALDYSAERLCAIYQPRRRRRHGGLLLRQGDQRGQLPFAENVPRAVPQQ